MKLYKKVFLTLSGAGILTGCCETKRTPPPPVKLYRVSAVIIQRDHNRPVAYLCDTDGDGLIDAHVDYAYRYNKRRLLRHALHIGDTIKFYTENPHDVYQNVFYRRGHPDSINNKSTDQVLDAFERQMQIDELRQSVTPQKQR